MYTTFLFNNPTVAFFIDQWGYFETFHITICIMGIQFLILRKGPRFTRTHEFTHVYAIDCHILRYLQDLVTVVSL